MGCCLKKERKFLCSCVQDICFGKCCEGLPCEDAKREIWSGKCLLNPSGTVIVHVDTACERQSAAKPGGVDVFINGEKVANVQAGETYSITVCPLEKIEIQCMQGKEGNTCKGKVSYAVNYEARNCF